MTDACRKRLHELTVWLVKQRVEFELSFSHKDVVVQKHIAWLKECESCLAEYDAVVGKVAELERRSEELGAARLTPEEEAHLMATGHLPEELY